METISDKVLRFYKGLDPPDFLPIEVEVMNPYKVDIAWDYTQKFYKKYFDDSNERVLLLGINPGRFGGGITGIPFTDPLQLENSCDIENQFEKRSELSSTFIYEMIHHLGGPATFYGKFYISAVCPLGFVKNGKNLNYYDIRELMEQWESFFVTKLKEQLSFCKSDQVFSIGQGQNISYLKLLNSKYKLFDKITALPHPRWVMQYKLKRKQAYIEEYSAKLAHHL